MLQATPTSSPSFPMPAMISGEIRALLLDDNTFDRARIRRLSDKTNLPVRLDEVDSIASLNEAVAKEHYDLVMIDYRLPVGDGMQALECLSHNDQNCNAGKIMITGDGARQTAVEAMRSGCHDFLTKEEMNVEALRSAMITALSAAHAHRQMALHREQQKELIRQGLVEAMRDTEVQGNVISIVRQQMRQHAFTADSRALNDSDLDALITALNDEDDFIFH